MAVSRGLYEGEFLECFEEVVLDGEVVVLLALESLVVDAIVGELECDVDVRRVLEDPVEFFELLGGLLGVLVEGV